MRLAPGPPRRSLLGSESIFILTLTLSLDCVGAWQKKKIVERGVEVLTQQHENMTEVKVRRMHFLQWNIHSECFLSCNTTAKPGWCDPAFPRCKNSAEAQLRQMMESGGNGMAAPDFAGVEQLVDSEFISSGLSAPAAWGHVTQSCGGEKGEGIYPFDRATLFYRKSRWAVKQLPDGTPFVSKGGCMETVRNVSVPNYRAFVMQAFQHRDSNLSVIVVVSHHPHVEQKGYEKKTQLLHDALSEMRRQSGIDSVVLIADTNQPSSSSGESIIREIYTDAGSISSTEIRTTCCYPLYIYPYDRIVAAGFPGSAPLMKTVLPFGDEAHHSPPPWVAMNMHDPVLGELVFNDEEQRSGGFRASAFALSVLAAAVCFLTDCIGS
eukprot:TRINITY_DN12736_c0_g1_i2.p1 TRINITY_DN12736_c0_g1~~TRINITY_DN12736_c0_g1_i2.p1  ORF type:complete len:379 (+),score=34.95 TRINITY_DN12736_c0_g1_i2:60-1196(+)